MVDGIKQLMDFKKKYDGTIDDAARGLADLIDGSLKFYDQQYQYDILRSLAKMINDKARNFKFDDKEI